MKSFTKNVLCSLLVAGAATMAMAGGTIIIGKVEQVKIDPTSLKVGQTYKLTVNGSQPEGAPCNMMVSIDGGVMWSPLGDVTVFPFIGAPGGVYSSFKAPGTYKIIVKGTTKPGAQCDGQASVDVNVVADPVIRAGAGGLTVQQSPCPTGWHGTAQASGAFSCSPNKPSTKVTCPPKTQYFETECAFGCQQIIY
jgi:hypothetical protein